VSRGLLAGLGRNARLIRATEREADRLGVYLLARAGYDPHKALGFWLRARAAAPASDWDFTHPPWGQRLALVEAEIHASTQPGSRPGRFRSPPISPQSFPSADLALNFRRQGRNRPEGSQGGVMVLVFGLVEALAAGGAPWRS
jgi:hypothetical protein